MEVIFVRKLKRVVIKEELVELTGDSVKSLILSQFLYWTDIMNNLDEKKKRDIEAFEKIGETYEANKLRKELRNGWFFKSAAELDDEIMISKRSTIDRKLKELIELPFIETRTPDEMAKTNREKANRSTWYRIDLKILHKELKKIGYPLEGYSLPEDEESLSDSIAQNEQSEKTLINSIAHFEQSTAQNEQSTAQNEQSYNVLLQNITTNTLVSKYVGANAQSIFELYKKDFKPTTHAKNSIELFCETYSPDLVAEAIQRAVMNEADKPIAFIKKVLFNWHEAGCSTVEQVLDHEKKFKEERKRKLAEKRKKQSSNKKIVRKEMVPEWHGKSNEENKADAKAHENMSDEEFEIEKRKLQEELKALNAELKNKGKEQPV